MVETDLPMVLFDPDLIERPVCSMYTVPHYQAMPYVPGCPRQEPHHLNVFGKQPVYVAESGVNKRYKYRYPRHGGGTVLG
jgi:hypothetical protein